MSDQPDPEATASRWWRYATEDLHTAQRLAGEGTSHRWVCVMAQQAAEKAVKTVLVARGIDFPRTHDVSRLVRLMPEGLLPEHDVEEFDRLSSWAVAGRYPADLRDAVRDDADRALDTARAVLSDVERILFPEEPERSRSPRSLSDRARAGPRLGTRVRPRRLQPRTARRRDPAGPPRTHTPDGRGCGRDCRVAAVRHVARGTQPVGHGGCSAAPSPGSGRPRAAASVLPEPLRPHAVSAGTVSVKYVIG